MRLFFSLCLMLAVPALAQDEQTPNRLYINPTTLVSASRLVGLGGASVGLGENTESIPFNYASVGNRSPRRTRVWDWDVSVSLLTSPVPSLRDVDNVGHDNQVQAAPLDAQLGGMVQIKRFGFGAYFRTSNRSVCDAPPCTDNSRLQLTSTQGAIVVGFSAWEDQLSFGIGLNMAKADLALQSQTVGYLGWGLGGGVLYKPHFLPFRVGASLVSNTAGGPTFSFAQQPNFAGRPTFTDVVTPGRVSVGLTWRLGDGAWRYNRLSPPAVKAMGPDVDPGDLPHDIDDDPRSPGQWLISGQMDLIFPVKGATDANSFLTGTGPAATIGGAYYLVPRAGVEYEVLENRLRLRAGFYVEPNFLLGSKVRAHGTAGAELFLFDVLAPWSVGFAIDGTSRYLSLSFGIGWWNAG